MSEALFKNSDILAMVVEYLAPDSLLLRDIDTLLTPTKIDGMCLSYNDLRKAALVNHTFLGVCRIQMYRHVQLPTQNHDSASLLANTVEVLQPSLARLVQSLDTAFSSTVGMRSIARILQSCKRLETSHVDASFLAYYPASGLAPKLRVLQISSYANAAALVPIAQCLDFEAMQSMCQAAKKVQLRNVWLDVPQEFVDELVYKRDMQVTRLQLVDSGFSDRFIERMKELWHSRTDNLFILNTTRVKRLLPGNIFNDNWMTLPLALARGLQHLCIYDYSLSGKIRFPPDTFHILTTLELHAPRAELPSARQLPASLRTLGLEGEDPGHILLDGFQDSATLPDLRELIVMFHVPNGTLENSVGREYRARVDAGRMALEAARNLSTCRLIVILRKSSPQT